MCLYVSRPGIGGYIGRPGIGRYVSRPGHGRVCRHARQCVRWHGVHHIIDQIINHLFTFLLSLRFTAISSKIERQLFALMLKQFWKRISFSSKISMWFLKCTYVSIFFSVQISMLYSHIFKVLDSLGIFQWYIDLIF